MTATQASASPKLRRRAIPLAFRLPFVVRNMLRRWRRTTFPVLGVGISLGIIVALLGVATGGTAIYTAEYIESSADLYVITHGGTIVAFLPGESPGMLESGNSLMNQIDQMPGTRQVVGITFGSLSHDLERRDTGQRRTEQLFVIGISGDPAQVPGMTAMKAGRWVERSDEIVLAPKLAETKGLVVGDIVTAGSQRLQVVGIGRINGVGFAGAGAAYVERSTLLAGDPHAELMSILIVDTEQPSQAAERIQAARKVDVYTADQVTNQLLNLMNTATVFYYLFSLMGLGIAALFVANVLTVSVSSRRAEFATLRAIGTPRRLILLMVVGEALVIALLAYIIGALFGTAIGEFLNRLYAPLVKVDRFVVFEPPIYVQVLLIAIALSVVSALLPARSALRIQPAEALREA